jgi:GDP-4-dehydro-6-deoxy-D-mannose reductase
METTSRQIKVLITGINGFAASHLARFLVNQGCEVHGTVRIRSDLHRIEDIKNSLTLHTMELTDYLNVESVILKVRPDEIYHLAAQSAVRQSWDMPSENYRINADGTINVMESVRKLDYMPRILNVSTCEVYGDVKEGVIDENTMPNPNTHYGISKYTQDMIGRLYQRAYGIPVMTSRSFNVTGAGRSDAFVDSNFAKQVVEIELGLKDPVIRHGNLASVRDFTDIKDVVKAYVSIIRLGVPGEVYVIASEKLVSIQLLLDILLKNSSLKDIKDEIDPDRMRPVDTKGTLGNATKIKQLGWEHTVPFETSMIELLDYWRSRLTK